MIWRALNLKLILIVYQAWGWEWVHIKVGGECHLMNGKMWILNVCTYKHIHVHHKMDAAHFLRLSKIGTFCVCLISIPIRYISNWFDIYRIESIYIDSIPIYIDSNRYISIQTDSIYIYRLKALKRGGMMSKHKVMRGLRE